MRADKTKIRMYGHYCPSCWEEVEKTRYRYYCGTCDQTIRRGNILNESGLEKALEKFRRLK